MAASEPLVNALSIGAAILAGGLIRTWARNRRTTKAAGPDGWRRLTPVWFAYPLAFVFPAAFILLVIVSITDKEPKTAGQIGITAVMLLFFGALGAYSLWGTFTRRVSWKDDTVRLSRSLLPDREWRISDARRITYSGTLGIRVLFADGTRLSFPTSDNGASELAEQFRESIRQCGDEDLLPE